MWVYPRVCTFVSVKIEERIRKSLDREGEFERSRIVKSVWTSRYEG